MFPLAPFLAVVLAGMTALAAYTDMQCRRIPNSLTAAGILTGFGLNLFLYGQAGLLNSFLGMTAALLVYLPLFLLRGMGAGDVKLMAALGAIAGPGNWLRIFICTALLGGVIAVAVISSRGVAPRAVRNIRRILAEPLQCRAPYQEYPELDVTSGAGLSLPHGAVIAVGTFIYVFVTSS